MKYRFILIALLCLLLLCGCSERGEKVSSGSDLPTQSIRPSASGSDAQQQDAARLANLLSGGGHWRSDQQGPGDPGVVVRELQFSGDGSFTYREGDAFSEFSWFASGQWTLEGDALRLRFSQTGEDFHALPEAAEQSAEYTVSFDAELLLLTQQSEAGLGSAALGTTFYFYHP